MVAGRDRPGRRLAVDGDRCDAKAEGVDDEAVRAGVVDDVMRCHAPDQVLAEVDIKIEIEVPGADVVRRR